MGKNAWWQFPLIRLYEYLAQNNPIQPSDLIFVMAGKMERKQYGLELYQAGVAPILVISIGRFEVSKLSRICLDRANAIIALRDKTPPAERHFFWLADDAGIHIEKAELPVWNTYGEAIGLRQYLARNHVQARKILVVSTDVHLRRVACTFTKVFGDSVEFVYCAVPLRLATLKQRRWWMRKENLCFVLKELSKLLGYRLILLLPGPAVHICMRVYGKLF